jgi:hypothetical protein
MSSRPRIAQIDGKKFAGMVAAADAVTATAPEEKFSLPDKTISFLANLPVNDEEKTEQGRLIGERFALNQRTLAFATRVLDARRARLTQKHEAAKAAVRRQQEIIEKLKLAIAEDGQLALRAENTLRSAQAEELVARNALKNLSRFASAATIAAAERKVEIEGRKVHEAEEASATWHNHVRTQKFTVLPAESTKLEELMAEESRAADELAGRIPGMRELGFVVA